MAKLTYRFYLSHPTIGLKEISEPVGWDDASLISERDSEYFGLNTVFTTDLVFYGKAHDGSDAGGDDIANIVETEGLDAEINVYIDVRPDTPEMDFERLFSGRLNLQSYRKTEEGVKIEVEQVSVWEDLISQKSKKFNLSGLVPNEITTHSRALLQQLDQHSNTDEGQEISSFLGPLQNVSNFTLYASYGGPNIIRDDLPAEQYISLLGNVDPTSVNKFLMKAERPELAGTYEFSGRVKGILQASQAGPAAGAQSVDITIKHRRYDPQDGTFEQVGIDETQTVFINITANYDNGNFDFQWAITFDLELNQEFYTYFEIDVPGIGPVAGYNEIEMIFNGSYDSSQNFTPFESNILLESDTVGNETQTEGLRIHEALDGLVQNMIGPNRFYSEYLGTTTTKNRVYEQDGNGAFYFLCTGYNLRGADYEDRPLVGSWDQIYNGFRDVMNLGLQVEEIDGQEVIRVEPLFNMFLSDKATLILDNIGGLDRRTLGIESELSEDFVFNALKTGYKKWETEEIAGSYEAISKIEMGLGNIYGKPLTRESSLIASMSAIEVTKRKSTTLGTEDWKYDESIFLIALSRDDSTSPNEYLSAAEKNELISTDLYSPETAYNLRINPVSNLLRHGNIINVSLWNKTNREYNYESIEGDNDWTITFSDEDEGNFAQGTIEANYESTITAIYSTTRNDSAPLFRPVFYEFDYPLSYQEWRALIKEKTDGILNSKRPILISQDGTTFKYVYVWKLDFKINEGYATFTCLQANIPDRVTTTTEVPPVDVEEPCGIGCMIIESSNNELVFEVA